MNLLHRNSVWTRRSGGEGSIEVHVETLIQLQVILMNLYRVNVMVAFKVNLAEVVLVEKIIGDDQSFVIVSQGNCMRAGLGAQADDTCLVRMIWVSYVEHADLASLEGGEEEPVSTSWHGQKLNHSSTDRNFDMRDNIFAIEDNLRSSGPGVYQVHEAVKHA